MKRSCFSCGRMSLICYPAIFLALLGAMYMQFVINGLLRSYGILYLEFLTIYNAGAATTSWIAFCFGVSMTVSAPFIGFVLDRVSEAKVVFYFCIVGTIGFLSCAWCTHITPVIFLYGILVGVAVQTLFISVVTFINRNFTSHQLLTNGIMFTGSSVGGMVFPFIFTALVTRYTVRGALLVFGGFWLNQCVAAMLLNTKLVRYDLRRHVKQRKEALQKRHIGAKEISGNLSLMEPIEMEVSIATSNRGDTPDHNNGVIEKPIADKKRTKLSAILYYLRLIFSIRFITIVVFWFFTIAGSQGVIQYLPAYAAEHGLTSLERSTLLTVINAFDLLARIVLASVADSQKVNKHILLTCMVAVCGLFSLGISLLTNRLTFYIYAVVYGLLADSCILFLGFTAVDSLGTENVGIGIGILSSVYGMSAMTSASVVGQLQSVYGSYVITFYMAAGFQLTASMCYWFGRFASRKGSSPQGKRFGNSV